MMGKQVSISKGLVLALVLVVVHTVCIANAANSIPEEESQLQSWFNSLIKPFGERKDSLEKSLAEAESAIEKITVSKDGTGKFKTITEAVESIPTGNKKRVIISIGPGEYKEKIKVERFKPYITFLGDSKDRPVLTFDGTAAKYGTVDSASLIIESDFFVASWWRDGGGGLHC